MPHPPLDTLLDRSAPTMPDTGGEPFRAEYDALSAAARMQTRRRRRGRRLIAGGAVLAVVFAGGATAAAATGFFSWTGWAAAPDIAYAFTLPSGRRCEERVLINTDVNAGFPSPGAGFSQGDALRTWAQTTDFSTLLDIPSAVAALDPSDGIPLAAKASGKHVVPDPNGPNALMVVLKPGGGLNNVPKTAAGPTPDDLYANAVDRALWQALEQKATALNGGQRATDWGTSLQMKCEPAA